MDVLEAIYRRRSVRAYEERPLPRQTIATLIGAAVQAPSGRNLQPWAFLVVDDRRRLKSYSDRAKTHFLGTLAPGAASLGIRERLFDPAFDIFYSAPALIVIAAKPTSEWATVDCCLAGQNLMLAALSMGLGTCAIGFARPWLGLPEVKRELGLPEDYVPTLPIIVGYPGEIPPAVQRVEPEILYASGK